MPATKKKSKTKKNLTRVNRCICVPQELNNRMTEFQENNEVNWSKIASRAFRKYMDKMEEEV